MLKHDTVRGRRGRGRKAKAGQAKVEQLKASTPEAVTPAANAAAVADANNTAVSGAKEAAAENTNSVRRPHMGGGVRCARVRLMEYRGLVVYARVLSRFPCARFRCSTDRNTAHQHRAPTPHPYRSGYLHSPPATYTAFLILTCPTPPAQVPPATAPVPKESVVFGEVSPVLKVKEADEQTPEQVSGRTRL